MVCSGKNTSCDYVRSKWWAGRLCEEQELGRGGGGGGEGGGEGGRGEESKGLL